MLLTKFSALILASFAISSGLSLPQNHSEPQPRESRNGWGYYQDRSCCRKSEHCCGRCSRGRCRGYCSLSCQGDAASVAASAAGSKDCQKQKTYGWKNYTLVEDNFNTQDCHDGCVYSVDGVPESRACFAEHIKDLTGDSGSTCFGPVGGAGGAPFTDESYATLGNISAISMALYEEAITNLKITYGSTTVRHGTQTGGKPSLCSYNGNERITVVTVEYFIDTPDFVASLSFTTESGYNCHLKNPTSRPINRRTFSKKGCYLSYFTGRTGHVVDNLGFCFVCP